MARARNRPRPVAARSTGCEVPAAAKPGELAARPTTAPQTPPAR
jgi:hypothetical protein